MKRRIKVKATIVATVIVNEDIKEVEEFKEV